MQISWVGRSTNSHNAKDEIDRLDLTWLLVFYRTSNTGTLPLSYSCALRTKWLISLIIVLCTGQLNHGVQLVRNKKILRPPPNCQRWKLPWFVPTTKLSNPCNICHGNPMSSDQLIKHCNATWVTKMLSLQAFCVAWWYWNAWLWVEWGGEEKAHVEGRR